MEIKGLKKSFGQGESHIDVLKGIDMTINKGEFCALLGPSGSGKSTLLNIIGGIDSLDEGELIINKHRLKTMKAKELSQDRRDHLGYKLVAKNL
nr:ATP-binding cassette domain-containing protein [Catenibacterium mitsuokai]